MIQSQTVTEWMGKGKTESKAEDILRLLELRFQTVPPEVQNGVRAMTDLVTLRQWFDLAYSTVSLDVFRQSAGV